MTDARIFQKPKSSMQSGRAGTDRWVLEYVPAEPRRADPLTGWAGSGDVVSDQICLTFPTLEAARAYAERNAIAARIVPAPPQRLKLQAYADNFR